MKRSFELSLKSALLGAMLCYSIVGFTQTASVLTEAKYASMRAEFLNVNAARFSEININDMSAAELETFLGGKLTGSPFMMEEKTGGISGTQNIYGATHSCTNQYGEQAACWFATGGTRGQKDTGDCGSSVQDNYVLATSDTSLHCQEEAPWSGMRFWMGTGNNDQFIEHHFPGARDMPLNRVCAEISFPGPENLSLGYSGSSDLASNPHLRQLVNPSTAGAHLRDIMWEWGVYVSPRTKENGDTTDKEMGGTYQNGGSHFYHKQTAYNRAPADRIYAIDENTLVACMGEIPVGVRSGMRPSYAANPYLTLGSADAEGITRAPNYINYLTRIYFQAEMDETSMANYPFDIAVNKLWVMYEENEIFAMSGQGSTLGEEMIGTGGTAMHPFKLYNRAADERTYRIFMAMGSNQILKHYEDEFILYVDDNANGVLDGSEANNPLTPGGLFTVPANTDISFILAHSPDFSDNNHTKDAHGRNFSQGSLSFIEEGRMRSASYAVRSWQGTAEQIADKQNWFNMTQYPDADNDWYFYKHLNLEKDVNSNPDLLRNTPDFLSALGLVEEQVAPPSPPSNLTVQIVE